MRALDRLTGLRVVADPDALDAAEWPDAVAVLRVAPEEAMGVEATTVAVSDQHALVVTDSGFAGCWLTDDELERDVMPHVEWELPSGRPALAQGFVAGVPAKLWLTDGTTLLICQAAYAHELADRLS